jgi:aryl-alcohol dehydrogenase-like predicted oxidoreductase
MATPVMSPTRPNYSLIGRDYEWELMPLGLDQGIGAVVWSPLGWGRLTGKICRGQPLPETSRLHKAAEMGPQPEDEYIYKSRRFGCCSSRDWQERSADRSELATGTPNCFFCHNRRSQ